MTTPPSRSSPSSGPSPPATALELVRLVVKAHGASAPAEIGGELLASLLTGSGATRGALALAPSEVATQLEAPRVLAAEGMNASQVSSLLAELAQRGDDHPTLSGRRWIRMMIPLGEQASEPPGLQRRDADIAYLLLTWEGERADEQQAYGRAYVGALRDAIAAVVVSVLATEREIELERLAEQRMGDHLNAELLGTVSHELRSPLAAIKGYASTLLRHERRLPREERHEFLAAIDEASIRLETIINRLLEISELETGHAVLDRFTMDLVPVVRDAVADVRTRTDGQARVPATVSLKMLDATGAATDREPLILADPRAMREVLDHLLENAVKYSPRGGEITVVLRPTPRGDISARHRLGPTPVPHEGAYLELVVSDQGVGIPDEHLGRIFDRFHRVDTRLTREVDGLGLGLAICSRLVELHGGTIWAESQPGQGSVFHILLPVASGAVGEQK